MGFFPFVLGFFSTSPSFAQETDLLHDWILEIETLEAFLRKKTPAEDAPFHEKDEYQALQSFLEELRLKIQDVRTEEDIHELEAEVSTFVNEYPLEAPFDKIPLLMNEFHSHYHGDKDDFQRWTESLRFTKNLEDEITRKENSEFGLILRAIQDFHLDISNLLFHNLSPYSVRPQDREPQSFAEIFRSSIVSHSPQERFYVLKYLANESASFQRTPDLMRALGDLQDFLNRHSVLKTSSLQIQAQQQLLEVEERVFSDQDRFDFQLTPVELPENSDLYFFELSAVAKVSDFIGIPYEISRTLVQTSEFNQEAVGQALEPLILSGESIRDWLRRISFFPLVEHHWQLRLYQKPKDGVPEKVGVMRLSIRRDPKTRHLGFVFEPLYFYTGSEHSSEIMRPDIRFVPRGTEILLFRHLFLEDLGHIPVIPDRIIEYGPRGWRVVGEEWRLARLNHQEISTSFHMSKDQSSRREAKYQKNSRILFGFDLKVSGFHQDKTR